MAYQIEADLPPNLACLKNVDTLLRCPICFDYLNISMMTQCSHNFCSLCIRKFLSYKLQCPVCNAQTTEPDLRNNRLLDNLVVNFQAARQQLSKAHVDSPPISPRTPASAVKCKTPREKSQKSSNSIMNNFFQKKLRSPPSKENRDVEQSELHTAQSPSVNDEELHSGKAHLSVLVKEEPVEVMNTPIQDLMPINKEDPGLYSVSAGFETAHSSSPSTDVKPIIKVECPVCSVSVPQHFINKHLDTCLSRDEKKESLRSSFSKRRRPMTKLVYNLLSLQELKKRLKDCHLSMQGTREQLIKRHQEYVHLYNAQCDSLNPKSAEEIAKEVEANEKIRNQLQGKTKPVMIFSKNQSEEEIDKMHSHYRKQHSSDFTRLIAQARGRLETTKRTRVKQGVTDEKEDVKELHSGDQVAEQKASVIVKEADRKPDGDHSAEVIELPSSPTWSDVSISSSISDIFGPEPSSNIEDTEGTSVQKRPFSSRDCDGSSSPAMGKRRRKT